jgi:hypothetical protein
MLFFLLPTIGWFTVLARVQKTTLFPVLFVTTAVLHSWYITYVGGICFGWCAGYPLAFGLLPIMVAWPQLTTTVWCGGRWFLLACVYGVQVAYAVDARKVLQTLVTVLVCWLLIHSFCIYVVPKKTDTMLIKTIAAVMPVYKKTFAQQLRATQEALRYVQQTNPDACAYLLPESVVAQDFTNILHLNHMLTNQVGIDAGMIIFGTHVVKKNKTYNGMALVNAVTGRITVGYVKKRLVPIFETEHAPAFTPGKIQQELLYVPKLGYVTPLICSEALGVYPYRQQFPLLVMVHDGHFRFRYTKQLIKACAYLQAGARNIPVIYSAYA